MAETDLTHTFNVSNQNPFIGQTVICTSNVVNGGALYERYHIIYSADNVPFFTSQILGVNPGASAITESQFVATSSGNADICAFLTYDTPLVSFTASAVSGIDSATITFTNTTQNPAGLPLEYRWYFEGRPDGNWGTMSIATTSTSLQTHTYALNTSNPVDTTFVVRLLAIDTASEAGYQAKNVNIVITASNAITVTSPSSGGVWQRGTPHVIAWNYIGSGLGTTVNIVLASYINYTHKSVSTIATGVPIGSGGSGSYTWTLPSTGVTGDYFKIFVQSSSNTAIYDYSDGVFTLTPAPAVPVAEFSATPLTGAAPLTVTFTNLSTGAEPMTYEWSFADPGFVSSRDKNYVGTYTTTGLKTVALVAIDANGVRSAQLVKTGYIRVT
jgi:hypothetical protein